MQEAARLGHSLDGAVEHAIEASEELSKLLAAHPYDPTVLKLQASVLGNLEKNPSAAERILVRITRIAPRDSDAWSLLGSFYLDSRRIEEGLRCFENAVSLDSVNPMYRAGLARGYAAANRSAEAEKAFRPALEAARPDSNPFVFLWYGDFLATEGRYEESSKAYSRIIAIDPGNGEAWLKRAAVEVRAGSYHDAEKDALVALERGAGEREAQTLLLRAYRELGEDAKARVAAAALERASDAEEEGRAKWRSARSALDQAERLVRADRFSEALPFYESVTRDVPGYAEAWFSAGMCYAHTADTKRAEQALQTYLRLQPNSSDGHGALGLLLLMQQRTTEARAELEEALRLDPASTEAKDALDSLTTRPK
jgi:tetratricopeptide (TPR) repeat protein